MLAVVDDMDGVLGQVRRLQRLFPASLVPIDGRCRKPVSPCIRQLLAVNPPPSAALRLPRKRCTPSNHAATLAAPVPQTISWGKRGHGGKVKDGAYVAGVVADFVVPGGLLGETFKRNKFDAAAAPKAGAVVSRSLRLLRASEGTTASATTVLASASAGTLRHVLSY